MDEDADVEPEPEDDVEPEPEDDVEPEPEDDEPRADGPTADRTTVGRADDTADPDAADERLAESGGDGDAADRDVDGAEDPDVADDGGDDADDSDTADADDSDIADDADDRPAPGVPDAADDGGAHATADVPEDVRKYARFKKMDGAQYERVNEFLRDRTYITAREWAIARLCSDFRTETGVEMTKIGEHLPQLVPFMTDTYTPQAVNQARSAFDEKVRKAGATFLYGAMCDFYTAEELDDVMYEVTEVAKFLLEVEGVDLTVEEELEAEERISSVMRDVRAASQELREEEVATGESDAGESTRSTASGSGDDGD